MSRKGTSEEIFRGRKTVMRPEESRPTPANMASGIANIAHLWYDNKDPPHDPADAAAGAGSSGMAYTAG